MDAALKAPEPIRQLPKRCRTDCIGEHEVPIGPEWATVVLYGKWLPGYAATQTDPAEPAGHEVTEAKLLFEAREYDIDPSGALATWAYEQIVEAQS